MHVLLNKKKWTILAEYTFIFLISVVPVLWYLGFLKASVHVPAIDTSTNIELFSYVYKEFLYSGELPLWNPLALYGQAWGYWYATISPSMVVSGLIGNLLNISNVLYLHYGSVAADTFLLLLLTNYLLRLFRIVLPIRIYALLIIVLTNIWLTSYYTNFRGEIFFPLILICVVKLYRTGEPKYFVLSGIAAILNLYGNVTYYAPVYFYLTLLLAGVSFWASPYKASFVFSKKNLLNALPYALLALLILAPYSYFNLVLPFISGDIEFVRPGRAEDLSIPFSIYYKSLDFFARHKFFELTGTLVGGHFAPGYFIGQLPFVLTLYGIIKAVFQKRNMEFLPIVIFFGVMFLVGFSQYTGFDYVVYALPGMKFARQLELLQSIMRVCLIILSAYGAQQLYLDIRLSWRNREGRYPAMFKSVYGWFMVFSLISMSYLWETVSNYSIRSRDFIHEYDRYHVIEIFGFVTLSLFFFHTLSTSFSKKNRYAPILIFYMLLVLLPYYKLMHVTYDTRVSKETAATMYPGTQYDYSAPRQELPSEFDKIPKKFKTFSGFFWATGHDLCVPKAGNDSLTPRLLDLLNAYFGGNRGDILKFMSGKDTAKGSEGLHTMLRAIASCNGPKYRFSDKYIKVETRKNGLKKLLEKPYLNGIDILELPNTVQFTKDKEYPFFGNISASDSANEFSIIKHTANRISLQSNTSRNQYLIINDGYSTKWHYNIDGGIERPVIAANYLFKAVEIPAGQHRIDVTYHDDRVKYAIWIFLLNGLFLYIITWYILLRRLLK